ncbi:MAG TPA: electron transport complex subunit RsxC [Candidatus Hydrothermia bacterium]|nr:electron transport complex subunit RsxC [Candidatus Hydrothermae bacterium]HRD22265.1 electron transport complex subunit RsxC [Candidatus Hydrothermia bacterium]
MAKSTFKGGVHPPYCKYTTGKGIEKLPVPATLYVPLSQHTGKPAKPLVKRGDEVKKGQKIADADGYISACIHAPTSGKVRTIIDHPHPVLLMSDFAIVIEPDGKDEWFEEPLERVNWQESSPEEIVNAVKEAGVVGLGGAAFPTHVKISPPKDKSIDTVIINGAECEPFLTADDRILQERAKDVLWGAFLVKRAVGASRVFIAVEDNKPLAIGKVSDVIKEFPSFELKVVKTKYPEGAEKQLIKALTDREVPRGGLPMDVNCLVQNVQTAVAIYEAVRFGKPLIERVLTLSGDGARGAGNYLVRIGTRFLDVVEMTGDMSDDVIKVINGGPMMGISQYTLEVPVIKGTSGILLFTQKTARRFEEYTCIRCSKCVDVCPMGLLPLMLVDYIKAGRFTEAKEKYGLSDCMECGCCAFVCPSKINHVQWVKFGKQELRRSS